MSRPPAACARPPDPAHGRRRRVAPYPAIALLLVLLLTVAGQAAATPRTSLPAIERQVMCVTCKIPLNVAESPQADRERAFIRALIARIDVQAERVDIQIRPSRLADILRGAPLDGGRDALVGPRRDALRHSGALREVTHSVIRELSFTTESHEEPRRALFKKKLFLRVTPWLFVVKKS